MNVLFLFAILFVFMYLLLIRPQRQQASRQKEMIEALKPGDEVITAGGIYGDIVEVMEDRVSLEISEDIEIEVSKRAIAQIIPAEEPEPAEIEADSRGRGDHRDRSGRRHRRACRRHLPGGLPPGIARTAVPPMRRYLLTLIAIAGALVAVVALSLVKSPTLGLDLQGGLAVVLQAEAPKGETVDRAGMDRSIEIMRARIDRLGVTEPEIRRQGEDQIIIELPGVHDADRAAEIVGTTARLEFYDLQDDALPPTKGTQTNEIVPTDNLQSLLTREDELKDGEEANEWYMYSIDNRLLAGPAQSKEALADELTSGEAPATAKYFVVPEGQIDPHVRRPAGLLPGPRDRARQDLLLPLQVRPDQQGEPGPGADR